MTPDRLFAICNMVALAGWLILAVFGRRRWAARLVTGSIIAGVLAIVYVTVLAAHMAPGQGSFGSLQGVAGLFRNPWILLAGWVHYLAFDLFIGSWQVRDAARLGIPHWWTLPCLLLTFWFGPAGLLAYFGLRWAKTRSLDLD